MTVKLKPLDEQVIVVTGASSGIGLATALSAAEAGAKVVLVARSGQTLEVIADDIRGAGGDALAVQADVGDRDAIEDVARRVIARYGRIDCWVNNAGVSIYGRLEELDDADGRRVFDTNVWGVVNGSLVALPHLKRHGGALINVGSEVSEAPVPLQGIYSASKHAVKGFTDALRIELEDEKADVAVTLIQPTAVDTPYPEHARNQMSAEAKLPTPMIEPEQVADAILAAATDPTRSVKVGTTAKINTFTAKVLPRVADLMARLQITRQHRAEPPVDPAGALHRPSEQTAGGAGRVYGRGDDRAPSGRDRAGPVEADRERIRQEDAATRQARSGGGE